MSLYIPGANCDPYVVLVGVPFFFKFSHWCVLSFFLFFPLFSIDGLVGGCLLSMTTTSCVRGG